MKTNPLVVTAILSSWATLAFVDFTYALPVLGFWICVFILTLIHKHHQWTRVMIALSAFTLIPSWNISKGIYDYSQGIAVSHYETGCGYFNDIYNIDKTTRMHYLPTGGGCFWDPHWRDFLVNATYDFTTESLISIFGPQKGSYKGVYLESPEAHNLLDKMGEEVYYFSERGWVDFRYQGKKYELTLNTGFIDYRKTESNTAKVYILNDELILFKPDNNYRSSLFSGYDDDTETFSKSKESNIYLIDAKTKKAFAFYEPQPLDLDLDFSHFNSLNFGSDYQELISKLYSDDLDLKFDLSKSKSSKNITLE